MDKIISELETMWNGVDQKSIKNLIHLLVNSKNKKIVGLGAGRMGYSMQSFIMRLSHLGFNASMLGDTNFPKVNSDTIALVNSSSGETPSMKLYVDQCIEAKVFIILFTANSESYIAKKSNHLITFPLFNSKQLMKTVYEQFSFILFDYISFEILKSSDLDVGWVEKNHSILE